jgi:hypothetical protein
MTASGDVADPPATVLVVRAIRPDDGAALQAFHHRLSADTIHYRFF